MSLSPDEGSFCRQRPSVSPRKGKKEQMTYNSRFVLMTAILLVAVLFLAHAVYARSSSGTPYGTEVATTIVGFNDLTPFDHQSQLRGQCRWRRPIGSCHQWLDHLHRSQQSLHLESERMRRSLALAATSCRCPRCPVVPRVAPASRMVTGRRPARLRPAILWQPTVVSVWPFSPTAWLNKRSSRKPPERTRPMS